MDVCPSNPLEWSLNGLEIAHGLATALLHVADAVGRYDHVMESSCNMHSFLCMPCAAKTSTEKNKEF